MRRLPRASDGRRELVEKYNEWPNGVGFPKVDDDDFRVGFRSKPSVEKRVAGPKCECAPDSGQRGRSGDSSESVHDCRSRADEPRGGYPRLEPSDDVPDEADERGVGGVGPALDVGRHGLGNLRDGPLYGDGAEVERKSSPDFEGLLVELGLAARNRGVE